MGFVHIRASVDDLRQLVRPRRRKTRSASRPIVRRLADAPVMKLAQSAYKQIMGEIGGRAPESGGVLLGPLKEYAATHFVFDEAGICTGTSWTFGHAWLNDVLQKYLRANMDAKGFIHSHPAGFRGLSGGDMLIPQKAFANTKNEDLYEVWMPIVVDGEIMPFIVYRDNPNHAEPAQLVLI